MSRHVPAPPSDLLPHDLSLVYSGYKEENQEWVSMGLKRYREKRDFKKTSEPSGRGRPTAAERFVVQEHHASRLHWDFRLQIEGVLKSWSVPKGPSLDPAAKRLAVEVEDHPVDYLTFTGEIPKGSYGGGVVYRWDIGTYEMIDGDPLEAWKKGALKFRLHGERLQGEWRLFKMKGRKQGGKPLWLLQKIADEFARPGDAAEPKGAEKQVEGKVKPISRIKPARIKRTAAPEGEPLSVEAFLGLTHPTGDVTVEIDGTHVALSHLDRIYWPKEKITKFDLLTYYIRIFPYLGPFLQDRPAILQRWPRGIGAPKFFQHDLQSAPEYLRTARMQNEEGREIDYAVYTGLPSLLHLVNLGTIEHHPWHSTLDRIDRPDWLVIDLDPRGALWEHVLKAAEVTREVFASRGLTVYPKTSGSSGIHIYLPLEPIYEYEAVAAFAEAIACEVASRIPEMATVERKPEERKEGQVYIDWLQNARGKSMVAPYSVRAKPGATVSMPLTWKEIGRGVEIADFTIRNVLDLVKKKKGLWERFFEERQRLPGPGEKRRRPAA
ncbi:MAG: hypothetical protein HY282_12195 [Nitrospirae bacterium]|nr:hypothetical protein [Candidatus Manganitrophaceae bacterium]